MINWSKLEPNRPLEPGNELYVERPTSPSAGVIDRLRQGTRVVLVTGPAGIGKSTELGHVAAAIRESSTTLIVPLDRMVNMRTITEAHLVRCTVHALIGMEHDAGRQIFLARHAGTDQLVRQIRAIVEESGRPVTFFMDGLEKMPEERSGPIFDELRTIAAEANLVVVMPWYMTYGPQSQSVIQDGEKFAHLRAVTVTGPSGEAGRKFFRALLARRLDLNITQAAALASDDLEVVDRAAFYSGGVPRAFLQLMADAGLRANYRAQRDWPTMEDLFLAANDMRDSFRRLLLQGDMDELRRVEGRSGLEMPLDRKLRLLNHGILLEYSNDPGVIMHIHPLVNEIG